MSPKPQIPDELAAGPFRGSVAVERDLLSKRQLRSKVWARVFRDVYLLADLADDDGLRADALRMVMPPGVIASGRTAAWRHGVWQPRPGALVPLEFARHRLGAGSPPAGLRGRRLAVMPTMQDDVPELADRCFGDLTIVNDIPTASVLRTCFELIRDRRLVEAVVVADAFAYAGVLTIPWLSAYVDLHRGWPGVRQARMVVDLASAQARSPGESRLRMIVVLGMLPEPLVNVPYYDRGNDLVGIPDLALLNVPRPTGLEYDGACHADPKQHVADLGRENRFTSGTALRLLRFGRNDVRLRPQEALDQIVRATGVSRWRPLDVDDFRRTPPHLSW